MITTADTLEFKSEALATAKLENFVRFRSRIATVFDAVVPVPPATWAPDRIRLDDAVEASAGMLDLSRRPWWRDILNAAMDPEVRSITIQAATQVGKTLSVIAMILWCAEHAPAPGIICLPDRDTALEIRDRVYANAIASHRHQPFKRITVPKKWLWNSRWIDLGSMRIYLAWAGSRQKLRGRPCKYVWLSEVDVYKGNPKAGNPVSSAQQRTKAFFKFLHFHESSPSEPPSEIAELEQSATARYRWHCPCPHCGREQELRFFPQAFGDEAGRGGIVGLKNEAGDYLSADDCRRQAHYKCLAGCLISDAEKQTMLERGRWVPLKAPTSRRSLGFHLWSVHSDTIRFGDIAAAYVEALQLGKLPEMFGNWLGIPFVGKSKLPTWKQLAAKLSWTNKRGTVPHHCWFLTAGADVQPDAVYWVVRGWSPGCTSWLVDWGMFERTAGDETDIVKSDLLQLGQLLDRRFVVVGGSNPLGKSQLGVRLLNVDSNHRTMDVHSWLQSLPEELRSGDDARVRAVRGDHKVDPAVRYRLHTVEQNTRTGEAYEGGLQQWGIYVYHFYQDLVERLAGEANRVGSWYVTADAAQLGEAYLKQVTNFHSVLDTHKSSGRRKRVWRPRTDKIPVDYWDCEIYGLVAAHMVVGTLGWAEAAWESWRSGRVNNRRQRRRSEAEDLTAR